MTFPCWQCFPFALNPRISNSNKGKEVLSILREERKQLAPSNEKQRWGSGLWTETRVKKSSNCFFQKALFASEKTQTHSPAEHADFWHKHVSLKTHRGDRQKLKTFSVWTTNTNSCKLRPRENISFSKAFQCPQDSILNRYALKNNYSFSKGTFKINPSKGTQVYPVVAKMLAEIHTGQTV